MATFHVLLIVFARFNLYLFLTLRTNGSNQANFEVFSKYDKSTAKLMTESRLGEIKKKLE